LDGGEVCTNDLCRGVEVCEFSGQASV
jgi:hypothetical protein